MRAMDELKWQFSVDDRGLVKGIENSTKSFRKIDTESKKSVKHLKNLDAGLDRTARRVSKAGNMIRKAFVGIGAVLGARMAYNFARSSISIASSLNEVQNVVDVTFGDMAGIIDDFAKRQAVSFGLSELAAKRYAGTMGAMLKSTGIATNEVTNMSLELTKLAGDIASFYNLSSDEAFSKIRSGISGQTRPLMELGINLSVANLEAYALSQGIKESYQSMSYANQTMLRYQYLLSVTSDAQGDFTRTSDSWANQTRILSLQFESLKANLGSAFVSVLLPVLKMLNTFIARLVQATSYVKSFFQALTGTNQSASSMGQALSSAASMASEGFDDMTDSVNQANNAMNNLAGFDKLNVLSQDQGTNTSGSLFMDTSMFDMGLNNIEQSTDETVNKMISKIERFKEVLARVWNSYPIQVFVESGRKLIGHAIDYWSSLFDQFKTNLGVTWDSIKDSLGIVLTNVTKLWITVWEDFSEVVDTYAKPIFDTMLQLFDSIWKDAIDPFVKLVIDVWTSMSQLLLDVWNKYGKDILIGVAKFILGIYETFKLIWDRVLNPIIKPFLEMLSWLWEKHLKSAFESVVEFVGKLIVNFLELWNKTLKPMIDWIIKVFGPSFAGAFSFIVDVVGSVFAFVIDLVKGLLKVLGGLIDFITGVFTGNWKKAWSGLVDVFKGIIELMLAPIKGIFNLIIDIANSLIRAANKISFDIPNWVPIIGGKKFGINIPLIPKFADGGIAFGPTLGLFAEYSNARANPEVVAPLDRLKSIIGDTANSEQLQLLQEQNRLLRDILNKEAVIEMDGSVISKKQQERNRREARIKGVVYSV